MRRRGFLRACGGLAGWAALGPRLAAAARGPRHDHPAALLVDTRGEPLRAGELEPGVNYLFHYPFAGTPCFLLNLGRPASPAEGLPTEGGGRYDWPGGVGPDRTIVAFTAICPHQLSHPEPQGSVINYHQEPAGEHSEAGEVITCCAHGSVFDPFRGGRVTHGPAPNPLPAVRLEHDPATDRLRATGTLGAERFDKFFELFRAELREEHGPGKAEQPVGDRATVRPLGDYTDFMVPC